MINEQVEFELYSILEKLGGGLTEAICHLVLGMHGLLLPHCPPECFIDDLFLIFRSIVLNIYLL